jgi:hypothetical protein
MSVSSRRGAAAFVAAVLLGACSGGGGLPSAGPTTSAGAGSPTTPGSGGGPVAGAGVVLHAKLTVTGDLAFTGVFDEPVGVASCAEVGAHGTRDLSESTDPAADAFYGTPSPPQGADGSYGSVGGGHTYDGGISIATYTGPGTFTGDALGGGLDEAFIDAQVDDQDTHNFQGDPASATAITKADGSGSLVFTDWQDANSTTVSGTLTWTCS